MSSPTQRSLSLLRQRGYVAAITEKWNQFAHIRQDLFGFIDIVGLKNQETLAVQTTSAVNLNARLRKIASIPEALIWLMAGNRIVCHGWKKAGPRGKRKTWQVREVEVTLDMLNSQKREKPTTE